MRRANAARLTLVSWHRDIHARLAIRSRAGAACNCATLPGGPVVAPRRRVLQRFHHTTILASIFLGACTTSGPGDDASADDATGTGDTASSEAGADTDEDSATSTTPGTGSDDGSTGNAPDACGDDAPTCFRDEPGICAHVVDEAPATCDGREWTCPDGFALEGDLQCTPEGDVVCTEGERCFVGGDCAAESYEPTCVSGMATCDRGDALECEWLCRPGDEPPDDCYDQGPGKCADFAPPPDCTDGVWTCPNGFDFGGYGEDCDFPG